MGLRYFSRSTITHRDYARRSIRDVNQVGRLRVYSMGAISGCIVIALEAILRALNFATPNIELLFGSFMTGDTNLVAWELGAVAFLLLSACCAFAYSFVFWSAHRSGATIGLNLSLIHWAISGVIAGLLPWVDSFLRVHPYYAPGFFWMNEGFGPSLIFFALHLAYGASLGMLFDWAARRKDRPLPISALA